MSITINPFNLSYSYAISKPFDFSDESIKTIITEGYKNPLSNEKISIEINKFKKLKKFLGKKRNKSLTQDEIEEIKPNLSEINPEKIIISEDDSDSINIEMFDKNKFYNSIDMLKKPFLIYKIYENVNKIDLDFIADTNILGEKYNDIDQYEYDLYYISNGQLKSRETFREFERIEIDNLLLFEEDLKDKSKTEGNKNDENILEIKPILLVLKSKLQDLNEDDIKFDNIYHELDGNTDIISPNKISKKYFYYFTINKQLQDKYKFFITDKRKKFFKLLDKFIKFGFKTKIMMIGGPKGIGKSSSIIYYSFQKSKRIFYINLEASNKNKNNLKKKDIMMELSKLYGFYENNDKNASKKEIEEYITHNYDKVEIIELLLNIINKFIIFADKIDANFCFIIDQISFSVINTKFKANLDNIIKSVENCCNLKLVLCFTLNNEYSKNLINTSFIKGKDSYKFYYFQSFFTKEDVVKNILYEENEEIIDAIDELGYLPGYYYEIKRENNIQNYLNYLEKNVIDNLEEYYGDNKISKILELLDLVIGEKVVSAKFLKENIDTIPLKYMNIKKMKINKQKLQKFEESNKDDIFIKYLNLFLFEAKNTSYDEIFELYYDILEIDAENFIENYLEKDINSRNLFGDYYNDYIINNRENILTKEHEIYIYKIEFSMNIIQKFLYTQIYDYLVKNYKLFLQLFSKSSLGGFFEVLINFALIKDNIKLFNIKIEQVIQIERIVPNDFSIKYFSSLRRKIKFKKFEIIKNAKPKILKYENTFIFQRIFNSKYYDAAILVKTDLPDVYDLILLQIIIKKDPNKRYNKQEHELIISYVKLNIENLYKINIRKAYFFYILSEKCGKIEDNDTKKNCDEIGIKYFSYDCENKKFNIKCNLEDGLITEKFLFHNCISLYNFKEIKDNKSQQNNLIKKLDFSNFIEITEDLFKRLKIIFNFFYTI